MKVISIVGARPQFIKLGPFSKVLRENASEIIIHTGQHYDEKMSDLLFKDLKIPAPDYNLNIGSGTQGVQTAGMLSAIEGILLKEKPDFVVVFGDTNSTLAGALASVKLRIPTVHIEAGLRSFNRDMPEEINRVATDHISDYLFVPTQTGMLNLKNEGLLGKGFLTGDIMVDSLNDNLKKAVEISKVEEQFGLHSDFFLLTLHRPYNVDDPSNLKQIVSKLGNLNKHIVFPIHPRTKNILEAHKISVPSNILCIPPQGYLDFLKLQWLSKKIITDSGGIQKEAYLLGRACITLRPETEWIETVQHGWNMLLDYLEDDFEEKLLNFLPTGVQPPVFGDGVAKKMVDIIMSL
ncbi:MAG: UDP-N-acetylglucosamine 2-epimerase (non-hydrolyzing) [Bacteroidales bacterium]|nr:UDP-N-acetylglucosamine 2-epimerase (non-hydrolyzing) [Bacteroidales bacterium]